ncbi:MAG: von Willebrand factor type A domain-containing protein [Flectobacillus sp.]|nr:von Willebrand factor type A domain-containing protein [Flectobacillus sp.]
MRQFALSCFLLLTSLLTFAQERIVEGNVIDENGQPLIGVTIRLKGTKRGTVTDTIGHYRLSIPKKFNTLLFDYVGYQSESVSALDKKVVNVQLRISTTPLQEVVVVGYGAAHKKQDLTSYVVRGKNSSVQYQPISTPVMSGDDGFSKEEYASEKEVGFKSTAKDPLTTFSIDVDRAAYTNVRRMIFQNGHLPDKDAVRVEEMINYFDYHYPQPHGNDPVSISTEVSTSPWNKGLQLIRIGLQAKNIPTDNLPASNLVFLIDVSGSMNTQNKLPLVKTAFKLLVDQLREQDKVSIVVYAGAAGLVLPPTSGKEKSKIKDALENLSAGGSTAGGEGIKLAYQTALQHFVAGGNNRVIMASDGDFNVGVSGVDELEKLIEEKRQTGVFLSILGFGMGNYKDNRMEKLSDKGNGNYAYIDNLLEAQKVFVKEFGGTLFTVAKDVKLQVEFNPVYIQAYRLIGYENRALANEDFKNDAKDAGDMGSGHTVTAIYEVVPRNIDSPYLVDKLKYQLNLTPIGSNSNELCTVKMRYKEPDANMSQQVEVVVKNEEIPFEKASENFRFAAAVSELGLLLRKSAYKGSASYNNVIEVASKALGKDEEGYRAEFIKLAKTAQLIEQTDTKGK